MEITMLTELFSAVGLPVAFIVVLIFVIYQMGKRMNDQADRNMERLQEQSHSREERLMEEIKENRIVNEKAIDTIARYSEKLDNIQTDVKEIKHDIAIFMGNGGHHND